jgi:hypothetical protein
MVGQQPGKRPPAAHGDALPAGAVVLLHHPAAHFMIAILRSHSALLNLSQASQGDGEPRDDLLRGQQGLFDLATKRAGAIEIYASGATCV